jgi:hypothetical protein
MIKQIIKNNICTNFLNKTKSEMYVYKSKCDTFMGRKEYLLLYYRAPWIETSMTIDWFLQKPTKLIRTSFEGLLKTGRLDLIFFKKLMWPICMSRELINELKWLLLIQV